MSKWETYPVAAAVYIRGRNNDSCLTHSVDLDAGVVLCRKVKIDSILDDGLWDGEGCTERAPTCPTCAKRLAKQRQEG